MGAEIVPYATVDELAIRWRALSDTEKLRAEMLLDEVAVMIDSHVAKELNAPVKDELWKLNAKRISLTAVERSMSTPAAFEGLTSMQQGAGSYQGTYTFANPTTKIYLSKSELSDLGVADSGTVIFSVPPKGIYKEA